MKTVIYSALVITLPILCLAEYDESAFAQLIRNGAIAKYVYRVVDDEGAPVSNATAHVRFSSYARPQDNADWRIDTDTNGIFVAEHRLNEKFTVGIGKAGYYRTYDKINYFGMSAEERLSKVKDGKWQPYGETRTVVLKKIKNPIRLCDPDARARHKYPESGKWVGFDLELCDWVSPLGNGKCSDMMVRYTRSARSDGYLKSLDVTFTNNPYAGVYLLNKDSYSEMNSVYAANTNGEYVSTLRYEFERTARGNHMISELGKNQYLVFRTRTEIDRDGRLISAHYGRIMGCWDYVETGNMILSSYFNPTPNDTNLEDTETARLSRLGYEQQLEFERRRKAGGK